MVPLPTYIIIRLTVIYTKLYTMYGTSMFHLLNQMCHRTILNFSTNYNT